MNWNVYFKCELNSLYSFSISRFSARHILIAGAILRRQWSQFTLYSVAKLYFFCDTCKFFEYFFLEKCYFYAFWAWNGQKRSCFQLRMTRIILNFVLLHTDILYLNTNYMDCMDKYLFNVRAQKVTQKSLKSQKSGYVLGFIDSWTLGSQKFLSW